MIHVALVDDNVNDLEALKYLLEKNFSNIFSSIVCFEDAASGLAHINATQPELAILDVEMPELDGVSLAGKIRSPQTEIVFYTSYPKYALDAYSNFALGFILKPIEEPTVVSVISKVLSIIRNKKNTVTQKKEHTAIIPDIISIPAQGCQFIVKVTDIIRIESANNYSKIYLNNGMFHICSYGIGHFEAQLKSYPFFQRIHKSHLVNFHWAAKYFSDGTLEMSSGTNIPVSRRKRTEIAKLLTYRYKKK